MIYGQTLFFFDFFFLDLFATKERNAQIEENHHTEDSKDETNTGMEVEKCSKKSQISFLSTASW